MNTRPGTSACVAAAEAADDSTTLPVRSLHRRNVLVRAHSRFATTSPSVAPPTLRCPSCDRPLVYEQSYLGGVSDRHAEQWDYFTCSTCGMFQYRQRTRKIRRVQMMPLRRDNDEERQLKTSARRQRPERRRGRSDAELRKQRAALKRQWEARQPRQRDARGTSADRLEDHDAKVTTKANRQSRHGVEREPAGERQR
jgi:hypothetical protein